jgi:hypothetical protein
LGVGVFEGAVGRGFGFAVAGFAGVGALDPESGDVGGVVLVFAVVSVGLGFGCGVGVWFGPGCQVGGLGPAV